MNKKDNIPETGEAGEKICPAENVSGVMGAGTREWQTKIIRCEAEAVRGRFNYADFLSTSAEFFDPNAMQLQTACSISFFRPASAT